MLLVNNDHLSNLVSVGLGNDVVQGGENAGHVARIDVNHGQEEYGRLALIHSGLRMIVLHEQFQAVCNEKN